MLERSGQREESQTQLKALAKLVPTDETTLNTMLMVYKISNTGASKYYPSLILLSNRISLHNILRNLL